ncbi:MAG: C1 family peptidase [Flavobacteriales bacterium]|nr:C1 family peptidase [Flavobacteriales bacterium]
MRRPFSLPCSITFLLLVLLTACNGGEAPHQDPARQDPEVNYGLELPGSHELPVVPIVRHDTTALDTLPRRVDLSAWFPPPGNQHQQYSCAAWAWAYGVQTYCSNRRNNRFGRRTGVPDPDVAYSPAYLFSLFKQVGDSLPCNKGVNLNNFVGFCGFAGLCTMSEVPYDTSLTGCNVEVPSSAMSLGMSLSLGGQVPAPTYLPQSNLNQWKAHLAAGEALMVLFVVDSVSFCAAGFEAARKDRPFTWDLATFDGKNSGGHAMACAGYDDSDSTLLVMNSFGQNWGTQGYVKIPYVNIRKKSFGAYAFPINGPGKVPHFNATPVADSIRSGLDTTDITMRAGQYVIVNGIKLVFTDLTPNGVFALVAVSNTGSRNAPYVLRMQAGSDWTFFDNGKSITFSWSRPGGAGTDVVFRAISIPATDDPTIRAYQQQLREAGHMHHTAAR